MYIKCKHINIICICIYRHTTLKKSMKAKKNSCQDADFTHGMLGI